jgi:hypothetical protein
MRTRQRAWAVSSGVRFQPRDAPLGRLIELRGEGPAKLWPVLHSGFTEYPPAKFDGVVEEPGKTGPE